jgi:protein SCO1/2
LEWRVAVGTLLLGCLILLLAGCGSHEFKGTEYRDAQPAPDFELENVAGGTFRPSDHQGKVLLLYFGYTFCPDICPATLAQVTVALDRLEEDADRVVMLFVTVDPERDTAEVMSNYVSAFHPNIIGLTGSRESLEAVFSAYGIVAEREELPDSAMEYAMNHTTRLFLVDPEGRLRLSYPFGTQPGDIVEDVTYLLK